MHYTIILLFFLLIQHGIPAFTVPQPDEAMRVLEDKAYQLDVKLHLFYKLTFLFYRI